MKTMWVSLAIVGCVAFSGCNTNSTPGGPGATTPGNNPPIGLKDGTFELNPPKMATTLKQGESKNVSIGIKRGKNFDEDVTLSFDKPPAGVTIEPASPVIKHGEDKVDISIKAAADAAEGDFTVKVTGHPQKGPDASVDLKIKVEKK
jgi:uncharacterized membrane protein